MTLDKRGSAHLRVVVAEGVGEVNDEAEVLAVVHQRAGAEPAGVLHPLHDLLQRG